MPRYKPTSIREEGLDIFLSGNASKHNGFGYAEFDKMVKAKVNTPNLARAFKVSRHTVEKWLKIYEEEHA